MHSPGGPMGLRLGIFGATGLVGRAMLTILAERDFAVGTPRLLAGDRSERRTIPFRGRELPVEAVSPAAFADLDLVLFAVANPLSEQWTPMARAKGASVIDNSSAFRYHDDVPLVVPEVNGERLDALPSLVANPNCSTIAIVMALAPLARAARLLRVGVSTYQSASGGGAETLEQFEQGVRDGLDGPPPPRPGGLAPIAYNVVPQIDRFETNGYTREEMKIVWETRKILGLPDLPVSATAVRVPVRVGHAAAVTATFDRRMDPQEAWRLWAAFPGVRVVDDPAHLRYPTPLESAGADDVLVGRARPDLAQTDSLTFFVASDNLRKGAALNAIQIAERMRPALEHAVRRGARS
jgi:aspartate-semialdehyde dehydrogenase